MRYTFLLLSLFFALAANCQFPASWTGNWKGELLWFKGNNPVPQKVKMQLSIAANAGGNYSWHLIYGDSARDSRPYMLMAKDSLKGHWLIDEGNGIVIDQFLTGNKLTGAFTVMSSTIVNSYWIEDGKLHVEFYNISAGPISKTGLGKDGSPEVSSYKVNSYQKAVLSK